MGHSWCSSGTESEAEQVEMRGSRHRRPCQLRIHLIVPAERVGAISHRRCLVHACVDVDAGSEKRKAESEKPHGPRRHAGAGDRQPHPNATGGWWWGSSAVAIGGPCRRHQQMSPLRIAGELRGLPWSKMWIAWNGPNRAYPSIFAAWAMGVRGRCAAQHAERKSWEESTELNLGLKNGEDSVSQGPVCFSRCPVQTHQKVTELSLARKPLLPTADCAYRRQQGVCAVVGKSGGGVGRGGQDGNSPLRFPCPSLPLPSS